MSYVHPQVSMITTKIQKNPRDFCSCHFSVLIRDVVERRLITHERKANKHPFLKPEEGPAGPGSMRDPSMGYEFQEQRPLPGTDAPYDKLMEEEEEEEDPIGLRRSLGREEQLQGRESWEG